MQHAVMLGTPADVIKVSWASNSDLATSALHAGTLRQIIAPVLQ